MKPNTITLVGRIAGDLHMKRFPNGKQVYHCFLTTGEPPQEQVSESPHRHVQRHHLVAWNQLASQLQQKAYKGTKLGVMGQLYYKHNRQQQEARIKVNSFMVLEG